MTVVSPSSEDYAAEIKAWLLGRVAKRRKTHQLNEPQQTELPPRALLWWIFEGKRYPWIECPLRDAWPIVDHHARRLLRTHNPVWRLVDVPEGETDWLASAFVSLTSTRPVYVSKASRPGLGDDEKQALLGWLLWVGSQWDDYTDALGISEEGLGPPRIESDLSFVTDRNALQRWAHIASRSRWPLLRNIVSESLRSALEPQELDKIPLPSEHPVLFEILSMVRILRNLEGEPDHLRWLSADSNVVEIPGLIYSYQHSLSRDDVLDTYEFDEPMRAAMTRHTVRVHKTPDGWLKLNPSRGGFDGVIVESKSGSQGYAAAMYQLKCYRAAIRRITKGRLLIWGIVEQAQDESPDALEQLRNEVASGTDDVWVFSSADDIEAVLAASGIAPEAVPAIASRGVAS